MAKSKMYIGRSGINTITELIYFNKPAILIPLYFNNKSEQLENARFFKNMGLGEYFLQDELSNKDLYSKILEFYKNLKNYKASQKILINNPETKILNILYDVCKKENT
jgi:UDP-N-acetylglucosamine--N-acetylmuramyl-(pentapeptide) pyrophosphoryl-undecaprenol N-acetylglucosamine transferase